MDCLFCNVAPVAHLHVPTVLGNVVDLCDDCWQQYGRRRSSCAKPPPNTTGGPPQTASSENKLKQPSQKKVTSHDKEQSTKRE